MGVEDWIPTYHPSGAEKVKAEGIPTSNPLGSASVTDSSGSNSSNTSNSGNSSSFCDKHGFLTMSDGGSSGIALGGGKAKEVSVGHVTSAELEKGDKAKGEGK